VDSSGVTDERRAHLRACGFAADLVEHVVANSCRPPDEAYASENLPQPEGRTRDEPARASGWFSDDDEARGHLIAGRPVPERLREAGERVRKQHREAARHHQQRKNRLDVSTKGGTVSFRLVRSGKRRGKFVRCPEPRVPLCSSSSSNSRSRSPRSVRRTTTRANAPPREPNDGDDEPRLTAAERRRSLRLLIHRAQLERVKRIADWRTCVRCVREQEPDEFSNGSTYCKACEAERIAERRRRVAA